MDIQRLPQEIRWILEDLLIPLNPGVDIDILIILLEVKIAQFLCFEGFVIEGLSDRPTPPNMYAMIFSRSGSGKNKPLGHIDRYIFKNWFDQKIQEWNKFREGEIVAITLKAQSIYKGLKSKQAEYIDYHSPRNLPKVIRDGTPEGITAEREMLYKWGKGSTFIFVEEFADYILSQNKAHDELLSLVKEIFDFGDSEVKSIKGNKDSIAVEGVPSNLLLTSSMQGLVEGTGKNKLEHFLVSGAVRRSFIINPAKHTKLTMKMLDNDLETINKWKEGANVFDDILKEVCACDKRITMGKETITRYNKWRIKNSKYKGDETILINRHNLYWKTLKLAGLFAAWGGRKEISIGDLDSAIYQAEYCEGSLIELSKDKDNMSEIFDFLLSVKSATKMDIREKRFVNVNAFAKWWNGIYPTLLEYAESRGYVITEEKIGSIGVKYVINKNEVEEVL